MILKLISVGNHLFWHHLAMGLKKPYARTKVGESCTCVMFIDLTDGSCNWDQYTWNTFQDQSTEKKH
jgi:hypothetical protein